jgi:hypothetical protein
MDIGSRTREEHAVDDLQQLADMRDVRQAREHQRQRIGHLRYRAQVSFSNKLYGKTIVHQVRVPDHANHWSVIEMLSFARPHARQVQAKYRNDASHHHDDRGLQCHLRK